MILSLEKIPDIVALNMKKLDKSQKVKCEQCGQKFRLK